MTKGLILSFFFLVSMFPDEHYSYHLENILFETNSDRVTEENIKQLQTNIITIRKSLLEHESKKFTLWINGNADRTENSPRRLSRNRANNIKVQLIKLGLTEGKLIARWYGTTRPVSHSMTDSGKRQNARVDFQIGFE
jgi:OmpA-OmpF porin, OOP family